jgi:hypothetical protein
MLLHFSSGAARLPDLTRESKVCQHNRTDGAILIPLVALSAELLLSLFQHPARIGVPLRQPHRIVLQ